MCAPTRAFIIGLMLLLSTLAACYDTGIEPVTGSLAVGLSVRGTELDTDGGLVAVDNGEARRLLDGESLLFTSLSAGTHVVSLTDIAANCYVEGPEFGPVEVTANDTVSHNYDVTCWESPPGQIAFQSDRDGELDSDIYVMRLDGSAATRVTFDGGSYEPALSSLGAQIAFTHWAEAGSSAEIVVMNTDGTLRRNASHHPSRDTEPAWSRDGRHIAFVSNRAYGDPGQAGIFAMAPDGSNQTLVVQGHCVSDPEWSPDGERVAYTGYCTGSAGFEILVVDLFGSDPVNLTNAEGDDFAPAWSPDGTRIAFNSYRDGDSEIYLMNADGSNVVQLTDDDATDIEPDWSPGGGWIAFSSDRGGDFDIYVMDANGDNVQNLTSHPAQDFSPSWSY